MGTSVNEGEVMEPVFMEVVMQTSDLVAGQVSRDDLEGPLEAALKEADLGVLTGGGSGSETSIIELEITDGNHVQDALRVIRRVLTEQKVPASTVIKQLEPELRIHSLRG